MLAVCSVVTILEHSAIRVANKDAVEDVFASSSWGAYACIFQARNMSICLDCTPAMGCTQAAKLSCRRPRQTTGSSQITHPSLTVKAPQWFLCGTDVTWKERAHLCLPVARAIASKFSRRRLGEAARWTGSFKLAQCLLHFWALPGCPPRRLIFLDSPLPDLRLEESTDVHHVRRGLSNNF